MDDTLENELDAERALSAMLATALDIAARYMQDDGEHVIVVPETQFTVGDVVQGALARYRLATNPFVPVGERKA